LVLRPTSPNSPAAGKIATRDAAQNDAFLREVDEALREDEFFTALRRHGKPALAAIFAGLALLAFYLWWGNHREGQRAAHGEQFTLALDQLDAGNLGPASTGLSSLASGTDGSAAGARLLQADIALKQGKNDEAARLYAAVYADQAAPEPFRQLANIREVAVRFDSLSPDVVVSRLKPLAIPGNPWFGSAGELVGMAYLKQGNKALAGPLFGAIARDKATPDSLRGRSRQIAGLMGFDAIDDIAKPSAGNAGGDGAGPAAGQ
jgi:hypothetical protein